MKNKIHSNIELNQSDTNAILCALPLVMAFETDSPAQRLLNTASCESATKKLLNHESSLSADEIRVVSCAISAAVCVISGDEMADMFDVDPEWKQELSHHFFTLNRLDPIFDSLVDEIQRRLH